jgi:putative ABC transport system permease protein
MLAIALAVGAIGVFAVPDVAAGSLRQIATEDQLAHIAADITPVTEAELAGVDLSALPAVEAMDAQLLRTIEIDGFGTARLLGADLGRQEIDVVTAAEGRLPTGPGEILVSEGMARIGDRIGQGSQQLEVVGIGGTAWWATDDIVFADLATVQSLTGIDGVNRLTLRLAEPTAANLDAAVASLNEAVAATGAAVTAVPTTVPDGRHPIEEDLEMISTMIGLLGVVAAVVALILLASTTNTLITERAREVAVMRALGGRRRALRFRLRGIAVGIAAAGAAIGIVLGTGVANVVARMVLTRFAGITPGFAVSPIVIAASVVFALIGAWFASGRAIRRVTRQPLAEALRDRSASPFGRRLSDRLIARLPIGGLLGRIALRTAAHRRGRTLAVGAQITAGVAAVITVASLGASVTAFDEAELEPWRFTSRTLAVDAGFPIPASAVGTATGTGTEGFEAGIYTLGEIGDWEVELIGLDAGTGVIDPTTRQGSWIEAGKRSVVVTDGFARNQGIEVGDTIDIGLASGTANYQVVGTHRWRSSAVFVPTEVLAADLGVPGYVNAIYALDPEADPATLDLPVATATVTLAELSAEGVAARAAIMDIFAAIGLIVAGVALLGVSSAMAVNVHERRHELAAMLAIGGRKAQVRRVLMTELVPLALAGAAAGSVAGWFGARWIIGAFEDASAVEIGTVFAAGMVPVATLVATGAVSLIAILAARRATRQPAAVTLRSAA